MKEGIGITLKGYVNLECRYVDGKIKWRTGWMENTISNSAFAAVSGLLGQIEEQEPFIWLAVGESTTAEAAGLSALGNEITTGQLMRTMATVTTVTTTQASDSLQLYHIWTSITSTTIQEIGIFNTSSAGVMLGRKLTTAKSIDSGETLAATYKIVSS